MMRLKELAGLALALGVIGCTVTDAVDSGDPPNDMEDASGADITDTSSPPDTTLPDAVITDTSEDMGSSDVATDIVADTTNPDTSSGEDTASPDLEPPPDPPVTYTPCANGDCWTSLSFSGACGTSTLNENFGSGLYNVHAFALSVPANVAVTLTLTRTGGTWDPALLLHNASGETVYDGERGAIDGSITVTLLDTGMSSGSASLEILSPVAQDLTVFLTGWSVVDSDFTAAMPTTASYAFLVDVDCVPPEGELLSPPNFDPSNTAGGFFLLPESDPPGLYTRKADDCSRGNKLLIDVVYTVAVRWNQLHPDLTPITILDLNEGSCSTVDHATHNDGTHVDIVVPCATRVDCTDDQPAIDLAKLFVDTGKVCGILNNNTNAQAVVNPYFESTYSYRPWRDQFMRTVTGHTGHFHVRVMKPDGTCN